LDRASTPENGEDNESTLEYDEESDSESAPEEGSVIANDEASFEVDPAEASRAGAMDTGRVPLEISARHGTEPSHYSRIPRTAPPAQLCGSNPVPSRGVGLQDSTSPWEPPTIFHHGDKIDEWFEEYNKTHKYENDGDSDDEDDKMSRDDVGGP
jgi:hypothetical protein